MEENKYYVPTAEDFRVGFEFQEYINGNWEYNVFRSIDCCNDWQDENVRVPYLTKEAIEAEGYECIHSSEFIVHFRIPNTHFSIVYFYIDKKLRIYEDYSNGGTLYNGLCRCINDFRLIIKMLGI